MDEPPNPHHDLHAFMSQITDDMASEYRRIYRSAAQDPGTAGDEGEENWANLLREWLPPAYHVATKGQLISHDGRRSPQVDVVVLSPSYPKKLREKRVWMAGGVVAAFECKTTLTAEHIKNAVEKCKQFKQLYVPQTGSPRLELNAPLFYGLLAHSHVWKGSGSKPELNVRNALDQANERIDHPRDEIDLICISDLSCWSRAWMAFPDSEFGPPEGREALRAVFGARWGPNTSHMFAGPSPNPNNPNFRPVGTALQAILQRLAWNDVSIREIADYFRSVGVGGTGSGICRHWSQSIYSEEVIRGVEAGRIEQFNDWSDWSMASF